MSNIKRRRPSAVSQVLGTISSYIDVSHLEDNLREDEDLNFIVATKPESRLRTYQLAYKVYHESGYLNNSENLCVSPYDEGDNTFVLIVQNSQGKDVGSATLNFDCDLGLPSDEIYNDELKSLRRMKRRVAEVTRLVVLPEYRNSKTLLMRMFNFLYIHAYYNMNQTDLIVVVNPRHVQYYSKLMGFKEIGKEKPCPRVSDSPGVLLSLSLKFGANQIKKHRLNLESTNKKIARFIKFFYGEVAEKKIKDFLRGKNSAWTSDELNMYKSILPSLV